MTLEPKNKISGGRLLSFKTQPSGNRAAAKSSGVLMASGYIAGGAIAGIIIAFMAGVLGDMDRSLTDWATAYNPFFESALADLLSMIPFACLTVLLYLVGRELLLGRKKPAA